MSKPKIKISVSGGNADIRKNVFEAFSDFDVQFGPEFIRKSAEDLPVQIVVFLGSALLDGAAWDLLKVAVKSLFQKKPEANVTLRDNTGIMYNIHEIKGDLNVNVVVVPDRQEEFNHIKTLDDLVEHLKSEKNGK